MRWLEYILRREETDVVREVMGWYSEGKMGREKPIKRWEDVIESDIKWAEVREEDVRDEDRIK